MRPALLKRLLLILVAFVAFAGVLAACGGDDGKSKDDVISEADKICQEAEEDLDDLEAGIEDSSDTGQIAASIRESEDRIEEAIDDLKAIDVPDEDKDKWDEFIDKTEEQVGIAGDLADAVEANDSTRIQELGDQADELEQESDQAAEDYGLDDCAQDDDDSSDSGSSTDDGTQPQAEVVTQANQACSDFQTEVEGIEQPSTPSEAGTYADRVSSELDQLINELNQLKPDSGQADYQQVISTFEQQRDKLGELADAARDSDQERIQEIDSEIDELTQDGADAAERFGIEECGSTSA